MNGERLKPACRLYVLVAANAEVALVFRRGPSDWWHLLHWDLHRRILTPGAWFHGNLYPRRSDISPDGRLFGYFCAEDRCSLRMAQCLLRGRQGALARSLSGLEDKRRVDVGLPVFGKRRTSY